MLTCPHLTTADSLGGAWTGWAAPPCEGTNNSLGSFGWVWLLVVVLVIVIVIVVAVVVKIVVEIGPMGGGNDGDGGNCRGEMVVETRGRGGGDGGEGGDGGNGGGQMVVETGCRGGSDGADGGEDGGELTHDDDL